VLVLAALALGRPPEAGAVAFRLPNQDPEAIARANAFVATADNPSAIYYNPAGITQLEGSDIRVGLYNVSAGVDYKSPSGANTSSPRSYFQQAPQLYYTYAPRTTNSLWSRFAFGLGVYVPYGLGLNWNDTTPFTTVAEKGEVMYLCVNPVVAVKITPKLSVAIGPTYNYSQAEFQRALGVFPGDSFEFKGRGDDWGFTAGVRWQPIEQLAFGASYRYKTQINYDGYSRTQPSPPFPGATSTHGTIDYPQYVIAGVSYRPTTNWNMEVDVDWTDWSSDKNIPIDNTAFGNVSLPLNYHSGYMYEFGITRQLPRKYFASVGYFYSENSSPNANYNPIVPDSNLQLGAVGFGHHGKHWDWAAAYLFGYNGGHTVTDDVAAPSADGTYKTFNQAINIAIGYKF
jgi:long-chain fatty acid transport protein